jgi:hypothetical protein
MSPRTLSEQDYRQKMIDAVAETIDEPVITAAAFNRRGLYTNKALGRFGAITYLLGRANAKRQAGGLPENFILAITPEKVRAFQYRARGRMRDQYEVGAEVAVWDRTALRVSWKNGPPYQVDVTIEAPDEEEKVLCRTGKGETTESFLQTLADPAAGG